MTLNSRPRRVRRRACIGAILAGLALAPVANAGSPPPPAVDLAQAPPLPGGRLLGVASGDTSASFLVLDNVFKKDGVADVWVFEAFAPPIEIGPGREVVQGLTHAQIDCAKRTQTRIQSVGYNDVGQPMVMVLRGQTVALELGGAYDLISDMLCRGLEPPVDNVLLGHEAALTAAKLILKPDAGQVAAPATATPVEATPSTPPATTPSAPAAPVVAPK